MVFNETLYFTANDGVTGKELWATDGSAAWLVKDIYPGHQGSNVQLVETIGNTLYFKADTRDGGDELWVSDGSVQMELFACEGFWIIPGFQNLLF